MSGKGRGYDYVVAGIIYAVEALKDQGIARWNYPMRCLHQRLNHSFRSMAAQPATASASNAQPSEISADVREVVVRKRKMEESVGKVMELSCWGPSTARF